MYLPQFRSATPPEPQDGDWRTWRHLLASRLHEPDGGHEGAMTIVTDNGYGTVSSSLLALPSVESDSRKPIYLFAAGRPGDVEYVPVGDA